MNKQRLGIALALLLSFSGLHAQPLSLSIRQVNGVDLPRIKLRVCLASGGLHVQWPGRATYRLTENGIDLPIMVDCPDSGVINSVDMVLDNSASMTLSLPDLKIACHHLIDSLRTNDEAGLVSFGPVKVLQDFTPDKNILHSAIDAMAAAGNTALWDAAMFSIQRLTLRSGKRICVLLTDGIDNASSARYEDVIAAALTQGIKVFSIGFGANAVSDRQLADLAKRTGGEYFRVFASSGLVHIFDAIASSIVDVCCTITYTATRCFDSVRAIRLDAALDTRSARVDTTYRSPFRADAQRLIVDAPPEIAPGGNANVYFKLLPGLGMGMTCSFRFLVRYDPVFLDVNPMLPITLGTVTQNTSASVRKLRPGVLQFSGEEILPGLDVDNLIGVRFTGLVSDSSRPVILAIDSLEVQAGCPISIATTNDTIEACQCRRAMPAWIANMAVQRASADVVCDIVVPDTSLSDPMIFTAEVLYETEKFVPTSVVTMGTATASSNLRWGVPEPGRLRIVADNTFNPQTMPILFRVIFRPLPMRTAIMTRLTLRSIRAWARCCPRNVSDTTVVVVLDGLCEKVLVRQGSVSLRQNTPNPVFGEATIAFELPSLENARMSPVRLSLYDMRGNSIRSLADGLFAPGYHSVHVDVRDLKSGVYLYVLESNGDIAVRTMTVVR